MILEPFEEITFFGPDPLLKIKELVIGVPLLKVLKFIQLLQGQVNLFSLEKFLKILLKFVKSRLIMKQYQELLLNMNFMLPNCTTKYSIDMVMG
jgi:hypothetical protein